MSGSPRTPAGRSLAPLQHKETRVGGQLAVSGVVEIGWVGYKKKQQQQQPETEQAFGRGREESELV